MKVHLIDGLDVDGAIIAVKCNPLTEITTTIGAINQEHLR